MFEIYEFEKITKNIYDDVREYCITEKVDEEYLRSSLIKDGEKKSMKRIIISVAAIGLFIIAMLSMTIKMDKELKSITKDMIHMNTYEVDTVSGATSSSQVIESAVSDALTKEM